MTSPPLSAGLCHAMFSIQSYNSEKDSCIERSPVKDCSPGSDIFRVEFKLVKKLAWAQANKAKLEPEPQQVPAVKPPHESQQRNDHQ